jgi:flagellar hook-associated protein 3 FlgL
MTSIGTLADNNQVLAYLQQLQAQSHDLEAQVTTGLKSQTFAGIPAQASTLVNLQASKAQQQSYIDTINTVSTRLQTMSLAMSNIQTLMTQFSAKLPQDAYNTQGATIQQEAQQLLTQIGGYLNTQDGTRYVFAGNQTSTPPFNQAGMPNPGDVTTNVGGAPPAGYYDGDAGIAQATIDTNVVVKYGITAGNPAFEQIIRVLNYYANNGPLDQTNPTDVANVNQSGQVLTNAISSLEQLEGQVGLQQAQLNNTQTALEASISLASTNIGNITQVDPATAITQLNTLQTQLQASYQTVSMLQQLTLANYLK